MDERTEVVMEPFTIKEYTPFSLEIHPGKIIRIDLIRTKASTTVRLGANYGNEFPHKWGRQDPWGRIWSLSPNADIFLRKQFEEGLISFAAKDDEEQVVTLEVEIQGRKSTNAFDIIRKGQEPLSVDLRVQSLLEHLDG